MKDLRLKETIREYPQFKGFLQDLDRNIKENRQYKTESVHEKISKNFNEKRDNE